MSTEALCLRTFSNCVRPHMNKKSVIKSFDTANKFALTGLQETKDASGIFVFYSLLLSSLSYAAEVDGETDIPDVSKTQATYLHSGQAPVPVKFVELAQSKDAAINVSTCFAINLIPNMPKSSLNIVLDAVLSLIVGDASLGKTTHKNFKAWRNEKAPADFLAEAFVLAIRVGKNKVDFSCEAADEIAPLLKNIDEIEAKLGTLPKLKPVPVPAKSTPVERRYIAALMDAYDDAIPNGTLPSEDLSQHPKFEKDLKQRRIEYFAAESVRRGTRENFRSNDPESLFSALKKETYDGVIDVHSMDYKHGFERLLKVMAHATQLPLEDCLLGKIPDWVGPSQKKGVCHMLVNDGEIEGWVDDDD